MRFTPKTKDEIAMDGLFPEGIYPFAVMKAEDTVSKASGAPMIKLQLTVYGDGERQMTVFDYLLESQVKKLSEFCEVTSLTANYEAGTLEADDCDGKQGWLKLKIDKGNGDFGPKNAVSFYCFEPKDAKPADKALRAVPPPGLDDEEIPF